MRFVKIQEMEPGMVLANTLYDDNGNVLLKANVELNKFFIRKIEKLSYSGIYVYEDNETAKEHKEMISEETRINAIKNLKNLNIDDCLYFANEIVDEVVSSGNFIFETMNLCTYDNYTYLHSLNVCLLSVVLGISCGLNNNELQKLSQAALLHDVGKICIEREILNKPGKLTDEEYKKMQNHTLYGYNMLKENENVYSVVRNAVYSHHENENGTGYPRNLTEDKIHKFAKIIHIADVYDALTAKRVYKEPMNPSDAIEYLMVQSNTMFKFEYVERFIKHIALYPLGTTVELSDGRLATVYKNNQEYLSRPIVRLKNGEKIDLMKVLNITIVKLINN